MRSDQAGSEIGRCDRSEFQARCITLGLWLHYLVCEVFFLVLRPKMTGGVLLCPAFDLMKSERTLFDGAAPSTMSR